MTRRRRARGFTLLEVIVVCALVAVVATLAVANQRSAVEEANRVSCLAYRLKVEESEVAYVGQQDAHSARISDLLSSGILNRERVCPSGGHYDWVPFPADDPEFQRHYGCSIHAWPGAGSGATKPPAGATKPPVGDTKPPVGDTNPPVGDTKPPVGDTKPPAGDTNPPAGDTKPPAGDTGPPPGDTGPPPGGTGPPTGAGDKAPVGGTDPTAGTVPPRPQPIDSTSIPSGSSLNRPPGWNNPHNPHSQTTDAPPGWTPNHGNPHH